MIASAYILVSSRIAVALARSVEDLERIERLKGLVFMGVTAVVLFVMNLIQLRALRAHQDDRMRRDRALHNAEQNILAGTFARSIAHDVNNGLAVAMMSFEELRPRLGQDAETLELAAEMDGALAQIKDWNQRFFALGSARLLGEERDFDLAVVLRNTGQLARRHAHVRSVQLSVDAQGPAPMRGREALVQRAILNLILNAAEAAGPACRIAVTLSRDETHHIVTVDDDGPGIPAAMREKVLEPFFTSKEHGTGLGLASVVTCATMHDGSVAIDQAPMGGARFVLRLRA